MPFPPRRKPGFGQGRTLSRDADGCVCGDAGEQDTSSPSLAPPPLPLASGWEGGKSAWWPQRRLPCLAYSSFSSPLGTCQAVFAGLFSLIHFNQKINQETPVQQIIEQ